MTRAETAALGCPRSDKYLLKKGVSLKEASVNLSTTPLLAIVGRPNVGKSTLFNKIVGSRRAIVGDEPGITRDRLYGNTEWRGRHMRLVDTGGIIPDEKNFIPAEIFRQARVAFQESAAIVMVVDGRSELTGPDQELARLLQKTGKPLFLAVNKVDSDKQEGLADEFHGLGIKNIFPISAEHGRGLDDLLDAIIEKLKLPVTGEPAPPEDVVPEVPESADGKTDKTQSPEAAEQTPETDVQLEAKTTREVKVAIIGHPNVGKSTLLNRLTGMDRSIVSPIPGTTRDAVDEVIERDGRKFRFIDTAGIRRKGKTNLMAEKLSVVMARKHLEAADIALLVFDATVGVSELDASMAGYAHESGRCVIIVFN
jgi:GTP-binding protein